MKRIFAALIIISIMLSSLCASANNNFATRGEICNMLLEAADFYNPSVKKEDILKGYEDGLLHEERFVTRAEALVMLNRAFPQMPEATGHNKRTALKAESFTDIPLWAEKELTAIFDRGLVAGTGKGVFSPDSNVTKEQMELFIKRVYSLYGKNYRDDFYATVNKNQLENLKIADGEYISGTMYDLQGIASNQINEIIRKIVNDNHAKGTPKQKIADFYDCVVNISERNKTGIAPVKKYLDKIDSVKNISELSLIQTLLSNELYLHPFMEFSLTVNLKNSTEYMLYFSAMNPIMNKEVYVNEGKEKDAYINYLKTILALGGEKEAYEKAISYFEFEKKLAKKMLSPQEKSDIGKIYNTYSYNKLYAMFPDFDIDEVVKACGLNKEDRILITDIKVTEEFASLYNQSNIENLKTAAKLCVLIACGAALNEDFEKAQEELDREILGITGEYDSTQRAFMTVQNVMADYLGEIYAEKYFDENSKKDVENMVYDIIEVFKERIDLLSWMSGKTKANAKRKLDSISVKIGYPDTVNSYLDDVEIVSTKKGGTYFSNMLAIKKESQKKYSSLQGQKVSRDMWAMFPYTVNACYDPTANDITLPAAILQAPLYDKNASYEENLGGIGYIIAHEITHAFDNNGARFDENGNLDNWWTKEDYEAFSLLCEKVASFYDGTEAISAIPTNGWLTLSENVADLGGAACVSELAKRDGADLKKLYTSMANVWASTKTREYASLAASTDTHSDDKIRINCVLSNTEDFYDAFGIEEGDGMYVPLSERVSVW